MKRMIYQNGLLIQKPSGMFFNYDNDHNGRVQGIEICVPADSPLTQITDVALYTDDGLFVGHFRYNPNDPHGHPRKQVYMSVEHLVYQTSREDRW